MRKVSYLQKWIGAIQNHVSVDRGRHEKNISGHLIIMCKNDMGLRIYCRVGYDGKLSYQPR